MNQFNITFTTSQLEWLGKLLARQPYYEVVELLNSINMQVQEQLRGSPDDASRP